MRKSLFSAFLLLCTTAFGQGQLGKYPKPNEGRANAKQITTVKTMSYSPFYGERKFKVATTTDLLSSNRLVTTAISTAILYSQRQ